MKMNLTILVFVLVGISTATEIFYVLPDNSSNISCPSRQCATFSQYFLDNDTLPVVSNVEYRLLPGEHVITTTETVKFSNFQNFTLVGEFNEQLKLSLTILVSSSIIIFDSYNITVTNVVFKTFPIYINANLWLAVCFSCTIDNVTLMGCGIRGNNIIGRSYLNNIVIYLTKSNSTLWCYDDQGITLNYYYSYSLFKEEEVAPDKHIITIQRISIYHDNSTCPTYKGIINIVIESHETKDVVDIIINDSKFNHMVQKIMNIKYHISEGIRSMIWIINCTFESNFVGHASLITAELPQFNTTLIFLKCKFQRNINNFLISVTSFDTAVNNIIMRKNVVWTNVTFNKCDFINNSGGLFYFNNTEDLSHYNFTVLLIGPICINGTKRNVDVNIMHMIYFHNMILHIQDAVSIVNNTAYDNIMVFEFCKVFINGPMTLSNNMGFLNHVMLLKSCSALFQ